MRNRDASRYCNSTFLTGHFPTLPSRLWKTFGTTNLASAPEEVPVYDWLQQELARRKANLPKNPSSSPRLRGSEAKGPQPSWALNINHQTLAYE